MVDENTGELVTDRLVKENSGKQPSLHRLIIRI